ncbi:MAG: 30S ribosomal protein S5 [Parcubacteria group bacterium ADurb.Bin316]|nr:MAG: 30S ribosomal protein S5 [Parcubacteria group bacterium ADurb.Bin316]HOZ56078.1 30S ribosomal protein S5 [bacterium]
MTEKKEKQDNLKTETAVGNQPAVGNELTDNLASSKSVYSEKKKIERTKKRIVGRSEVKDEYEQKIIDIARVTRVMAGGKRMRFRACVAVGNKSGKVGVGIAKGADVTLAVTKAVNDAKKKIVDVSIINTTIPHEVYNKTGAAKVLLKPARKGNGVIAGGAVRMVLELAGIQNITSKNLGTNNKVNIAKCTVEALRSLKKIEKNKKNNNDAKNEEVKTENYKK